jgi:hypothetical protein
MPIKTAGKTYTLYSNMVSKNLAGDQHFKGIWLLYSLTPLTLKDSEFFP